MRIKVDGNALIACVSQVVKVTGSKHVSILAEDDELRVASAERGRTMVLRMDAAVKEGGGVTMMPDTLIGVCRNRKEIELALSDDESKVTVKSGKYEADLTVLPYEQIDVEEPEGLELSMEDAELKVLLDVCNAAQLAQPYKDGCPSLPLFIAFGEKGTHVASLDQFHAASVRTKQITREDEQELLVPAGTLSAVASAADGNTYRLVLADSVVFANNERFELILPLEQPEGSNLGLNNIKMLRDVIRNSDEVTSISVDREELDTILTNIYSVSESGVAISFTAKKGSLTVSSNTNYGSASETLDAKVVGKGGKFQFTPGLIAEVFAKLRGDTIELNILPKFMYIETKNGETSCLYIVLRTA
jgi:DNA polymerase III sliding clamp (beta) subunit (PCNA family)